MIALAQTLHGYDRGHRLLACGGDVSDDELAVLDRLSDLSGYLPSGLSFDHYYSGFPCGRYYAFACTWLDTAAPRLGTVLTHTLLVPLEQIASTSDLFVFAALHRRPVSAEDTEPYARAPEALVAPADTIPMPLNARAALALYIGQRQRPILWMDDAQPVPIIRYLWYLSWPALRKRLAFCTFALQERSLDGQVFDFLGVPPEAQGSFHKYAGSAAWWLQGELARPALLELPSIEAIERGGAAWAGALLERGRTLGLPDPASAPDLWRLHRLIEVREASRERLTAARAHADLLARLWPSLRAEHPEWRCALDALLATQRQAALAPRPLWELVHLVVRPQLWSLMERDDAFTQRVEEVLVSEVAHRLRETELARTSLTVLLDALGERPLRDAVYRAVTMAVSSGDREVARALLIASTNRRDASLARACIQALPPQDRTALLVGEQGILLVHGDAGERVWLTRKAADLAVELGEPLLAFTAWQLLDEPVTGLGRATQAAARSTPQALQLVLQRVEPALRLDWSLHRTEAALLGMAAHHGAEAVRELGLGVHALASRCAGASNGARVFVHACALRREDELTPVLADWPELSWNITMLVLGDEQVAPALVRAALQALTPERLWSPDTRQILSTDHAGLPRLLEQLGARLLRDIAHGSVEPGNGAAWLRVTPVQEWLRATSKWSIDRALERTPQSGLQAFVVTLQQTLMTDEEACRWLLQPIYTLLHGAGRVGMELAASALLELLSLPAFHGAVQLRAEILLAVIQTDADTSPLVAAVFHDAYAAVVSQHAALRSMRWPWSWGWDVAKALRHWMLDTWAERRWPVAQLLACLDRDADLARQVFERARKRASWWKMDNVIRQLEPAVANDPFLYPLWQGSKGDWW